MRRMGMRGMWLVPLAICTAFLAASAYAHSLDKTKVLSAARVVKPQRFAQNRADFKAYDNYDLTGTDLRSLTNVDLQNCSAACQSDNQCQAYSYNKWARQCFLKATPGLLRFEPRFVAGVSGQLPPTSDASWGIIHYRGWSFTGDAYRSQTMPSYQQCEKTCENEQDCVGGSYLTKQQTCKLFQTFGGLSADANTDSGLKHQGKSFLSVDPFFDDAIENPNSPVKDIPTAKIAPAVDGDVVVLRSNSPFLGASISNPTPALIEELRLGGASNGVVITGVDAGSPAASTGFVRGDIVIAVNGQILNKTADLDRIARAGGSEWDIAIERGGQQIRVFFSSR